MVAFRPLVSAAVFVSPALTSQAAHAGGFLLQEQSQLEIGRAFSGAAASADNPSTVFYNPAGMTELDGVQASTGGAFIFVQSGQRDRGTARTAPLSGSAVPVPVGGSDGGNPFAPIVVVPTGYVTAQAGNSGLWLGLGVTAPYGLKLGYDSDFFGRYDSIYSKLMTIDAQPSVAYRVNDTVSVGGGIDVQYAKVRLTSALPQLDPALADGEASVSGHDVAVGWNAGLLLKLKGDIRLGLHYRSRIRHDIKGTNIFSGLAGPLSAVNGSSPIRSPLTLPDNVTASLSAPVDSKTRLMITGRFYNWSVFRGIDIRFPNGTVLSKQLDYRDSWSLSAGIDRRIDDRLIVRAGTMHDRTPTNPRFLSTRVPDGDRDWATTGLGYRLNDRLTLDLSYAHVWVRRQTLDRVDGFYGATPLVSVTNRAQSSGNIDILATSVTARF